MLIDVSAIYEEEMESFPSLNDIRKLKSIKPSTQEIEKRILKKKPITEQKEKEISIINNQKENILTEKDEKESEKKEDLEAIYIIKMRKAEKFMDISRKPIDPFPGRGLAEYWNETYEESEDEKKIRTNNIEITKDTKIKKGVSSPKTLSSKYQL